MRTTNLSELRISREVADFVALDSALNPDHQPSAVWPSVITDTRFTELIHTAIEHSSKLYLGSSKESRDKYEGFVEGLSFAVEAIRQSIKENEADQSIIQLLGDAKE